VAGVLIAIYTGFKTVLSHILKSASKLAGLTRLFPPGISVPVPKCNLQKDFDFRLSTSEVKGTRLSDQDPISPGRSVPGLPVSEAASIWTTTAFESKAADPVVAPGNIKARLNFFSAW
jgi:hypothetical protein